MDWKWKYKEQSWETLEALGGYYNRVCRILRMRYKWSPNVVDALDLRRLRRILDETKEDFKKSGPDEDDFE